MAANDLEMWTVYRPTTKDHPGKWVVRRWLISNEMIPCPEFKLFDTLAAARAAMPRGTVRLNRHPEDDAVIEETWV